MKNLAIIPARSGSKGLLNKNIKVLNGLPLLAHSIITAKESGIFHEVMVSTDSNEYAQIAIKYGAKVPYLRNSDLSTDTASSWDVVRNVLEYYATKGVKFDSVTLLQPTSPLRTVNDLKNAFTIFETKNANAVVSVVEVDHSPLWMNVLPFDNNLLNFISPEIESKNRQSLKVFYRINGAIYIIRTNFFDCMETIYTTNSYASIMNKLSSIDIDNEFDFAFAEFAFKIRYLNKD